MFHLKKILLLLNFLLVLFSSINFSVANTAPVPGGGGGLTGADCPSGETEEIDFDISGTGNPFRSTVCKAPSAQQMTNFRTDLEAFANSPRPPGYKGVFVTTVDGNRYDDFARTAKKYNVRCEIEANADNIRVRPIAYLFYPIDEKFLHHPNEKGNYPGVICSKYSSWLIDMVTGSANAGANNVNSQFTLINLVYTLIGNIGRFFYNAFIPLSAIYLMFLGFKITRGEIEPFEIIKEMAFIGFLLFLLRSTNQANGFYRQIMTFIFDMHNFMLGMSFVNGGNYTQAPTTLSATIDGMHGFNEAYADAFWHSTYFSVKMTVAGIGIGPPNVPDGINVSWTGAFTALAIKLSGMLNVWGATEALLVSKLVILVIATVGPIFISLFIFDTTKKFTFQWISELFEQLFTAMLIGVMLRLLMGRMFGLVAGMGSGGDITTDIVGKVGLGAGVGAVAASGVNTALVLGATAAGGATATVIGSLLSPILVGGAVVGSFFYVALMMTSLNAIFWLLIRQSNKIAAHLTGGFGMDIFSNAATNNMIAGIGKIVGATVGGVTKGIGQAGKLNQAYKLNQAGGGGPGGGGPGGGGPKGGNPKNDNNRGLNLRNPFARSTQATSGGGGGGGGGGSQPSYKVQRAMAENRQEAADNWGANAEKIFVETAKAATMNTGDPLGAITASKWKAIKSRKKIEEDVAKTEEKNQIEKEKNEMHKETYGNFIARQPARSPQENPQASKQANGVFISPPAP